MKTIRVLMSTDTVGGVWTYALDLCAALDKTGVEIALATMGPALSREQRLAVSKLSGVEVFQSHYKLEWMSDPWEHLEEAGQWLLELETGTRADVVHLNHYAHGSLPWRAPVLMTGHSCVFSWYEAVRKTPPGPQWARYRRCVAAGLREADLVTAPSKWMLEQLRKHYGPFITTGPISNGRDLSQLRPGVKEPIIMATGRLWDEAKNAGALDYAANHVSWPIYAAGSLQSPDGNAARLNRVKHLGILDTSQVAHWLGRAALYAAPALYEPFGLGVLEAAASGCALVLGDIPSLRENWDGAALFVNPRSPEEISDALKTFSKSMEMCEKLGRTAAGRAMHLSATRMAREYRKLYSDLLSSAGSTRRVCAAMSPVKRAIPVVIPPALSTTGEKLSMAFFYHSLVSDWNNGNAHFLRGVVAELRSRGHSVRVYEPRGGWSLSNLLVTEGASVLQRFRDSFPSLNSITYDPETADLDEMLDGVDLAIVHEWNDPDFVRRIGRHRQTNGYHLLFHDTHHRAISDPSRIEEFKPENFDGVLVFGDSLRQVYVERGWSSQVWTWHEAADTTIFRPHPHPRRFQGDLVWIGNWGDNERDAELGEFLIQPCKTLRLSARVHGVRYPESALRSLSEAGIGFGGWVPNFEVPRVFSDFRVTVHVPRRFYREHLPGIPTIRVFEALACGIPLVCAPWRDSEGLFTPGEDFLVALSGREMSRHLRYLLNDSEAAAAIARRGLETILKRHTCAHRVDQLLSIARKLGVGRPRQRRGNFYVHHNQPVPAGG